MNVIERAILEWSYKTKKGYPDLNNEEDLKIFKSLFGFSINEGLKEKDAKKNFAAHQGFPKDNSFSGKLLCGFAKEKGELKLDGSPKWHCPMKFDFFFYEVWDSNKEKIGSYFEDEFSEDLVPQGGGYEMKYYQGCPAHSS